MLVLRASDIFQFIFTEEHWFPAVRAVAAIITIGATYLINDENFVGGHITLL